MQTHTLVLGLRERTTFVPDRVGNAEVSEILDECRAADVALRQSELTRGTARQLGDASRASDAPRRFEIGKVTDRGECGIELRPR